MDWKKYQKEASRTRVDLGSKEKNTQHMLLGLFDEVGELANIFKKSVAYGKPVDWSHVKEEIGDLQWFISGMCDVNDLDHSEILQTNIDKLKVRFPKKFTNSHALHRDLKSERVVITANE